MSQNVENRVERLRVQVEGSTGSSLFSSFLSYCGVNLVGYLCLLSYTLNCGKLASYTICTISLEISLSFINFPFLHFICVDFIQIIWPFFTYIDVIHYKSCLFPTKCFPVVTKFRLITQNKNLPPGIHFLWPQSSFINTKWMQIKQLI